MGDVVGADDDDGEVGAHVQGPVHLAEQISAAGAHGGRVHQAHWTVEHVAHALCDHRRRRVPGLPRPEPRRQRVPEHRETLRCALLARTVQTIRVGRGLSADPDLAACVPALGERHPEGRRTQTERATATVRSGHREAFGVLRTAHRTTPSRRRNPRTASRAPVSMCGPWVNAATR